MSDLVGGLQNRIGQFDPGIALKYKVVINKLTSIIGSNPILSTNNFGWLAKWLLQSLQFIKFSLCNLKFINISSNMICEK